MIIKMRNKNYKLDTNECCYDVSVTTPENVLILKRGDLVFLTVHLDNLCLGSKLDVLNLFDIKIEEVSN